MPLRRWSERAKDLAGPSYRAPGPRLEALEGRDTPAPLAGPITTVAGVGSSGDGLQATVARLSDPWDVVVDAAGDLFIADRYGDRVRRVDAKTGIITTIAGTGIFGDSGDGGPATAARLSDPTGIAVDQSGNVFIAEGTAQRVRRVDGTTGIITTVAGTGTRGYTGDGGPATAAELYYPVSVAVNSAGDLFIADENNNAVRRVDGKTGIITTFAGTGKAGVSGDGGPAGAADLGVPDGVALDAAGNLFIAQDDPWRVVRRVNGATGVITTVPGTDLSEPEGIAVDAAGTLFISDSGASQVLKVDATTGAVTIVSGTSRDGYQFGFSGNGGPARAAHLFNPTGVAVDAAGNVFIADSRNNQIRKVDAATGVITTVAGTEPGVARGDGGPATAATLDQPAGIVSTAAGDLLIADTGDNVVRRVDGKTGVITTVAGRGAAGQTGDGGPAIAAQLTGPEGLAVDAVGDLFIADTANRVIRRVDAKTEVITTVAGTGVFGGFGGDGGAATEADLNRPTGVAVDAAGDLFIADAGIGRVRRVDAKTGVITTVAGNGTAGFAGDGSPATAAELGDPEGLAVDAAGDLFIADAGMNRVRRVDAKTGVITTVAGNGVRGSAGDGGPATAAGLAGPKGITLDPAGDLFIADAGNYRVRRVDAKTGVITTVAGGGTNGYGEEGGSSTAAGLSAPSGVAMTPGGDLVIADSGYNAIRKVSLSSAARLLVGTKQFAVGTDSGGTVTVYNPDQSVAYSSTPFASASGGVRTAMADFTGDGIADLVAGAGPGAPAQVVISDGTTHKTLAILSPFEASFTGGVFVAAGDLTGDGVPDLVVTPDQTGGPVVVVYDGAALAKGQAVEVARFYGIDDPNFRGGARAAVGDLTGGGDLVVAAGFGGGPRVAVFDGASLASGTPARVVPDFYAFEPTLRNGAYVTAGDLTGARTADLIFGAGPGGGPRVRAENFQQLLAATGGFTTLDDPAVQSAQVANFYAGDPAARGGVPVAVKDLTGNGLAGVVAGSGAGGTVTGYTGAAVAANGTGPAPAFTLSPFPGFTGGVFVG